MKSGIDVENKAALFSTIIFVSQYGSTTARKLIAVVGSGRKGACTGPRWCQAPFRFTFSPSFVATHDFYARQLA